MNPLLVQLPQRMASSTLPTPRLGIQFNDQIMHARRRVRNQDGTPKVTDSVYFVKNPACPNQKPGTPLSTAPPPTTAAPPATTAAPRATTAAPPAAAPVPPPVVPAPPSNPLDVLSGIKNAADTNVIGGILSQQG
jgi:hypothetical protein